MNRIMEKKPILHAVLWIFIYIVAVNIGNALSEQIGVDQVTGVLLIVLSFVLVVYLKRANQLNSFGVKGITKLDLRKTLFYAPLVILAFLQLLAGINTALSMEEIATFCLLMIGVGFLEELIFRGMLFQGIYAKSGVNRAVLISGITFGIGHIVNLLNGYSIEEQLGQIIVAIAIGIVLALIVAITKSIVPGALFHIVFNISGSIMKEKSDIETYILIAILCISAIYALYLFRILKKENK
ncbi:MAG: Abortive infection protein [Clostridiales bacterium]|nr:Abortive infection protein [Clostridiales bacterium]